MKVFLLFIFSISCFSQIKQPDTDFYIHENSVYWQHTYDAPNQSIEDLSIQFLKLIDGNIKFNNLKKTTTEITFEVVDDVPNYKKYGGSLMTVNYIASLYMNYNVNAEFKEGKYRVTIKNIVLDNKQAGFLKTDGKIEDFCTRNKSTEFKTGSNITQGLIYDHKHFTEKFDIKTLSNQNSNW